MARWVRLAAILSLFAFLTPIQGHATNEGTTRVYWDHTERMDFLTDPYGRGGTLVNTWDTNGQMCLLPDGSGRFVVGYNPTHADQGLGVQPFKDPPVGEALWNADGTFSGKTIYVPGPYSNTGSTVGGDIPPDPGSNNLFNGNGTMTGCAFGKDANLFATDIGTAQGSFPVPDNGRLIEWFAATDYTTYCILAGPTQGGDSGTGHHVDGSGGLRDPGMMSADADGNVYVPEIGAQDPITGQIPGFGRILKFNASSLPADASACPAPSNMPSTPVTPSIWLQGTPAFMPVPSSIARDPSCTCWAVANILGFPAVAWFNDDGTPFVGKGPLLPGNYTPFGMGFTPDGTLYFVDIHVTVNPPSSEQIQNGSPVNIGPATQAGGVFRVSFTAGIPSIPVAVATNLDYPTSVTVCNELVQTCPFPA